MTYKIKITGKKYNESYTFEDPREGSIREEISAILREMRKGNIESVEIKKED